MLDVCLLGCGGMLPLPDRHLTALTVRLNGHRLLIDCGEGTQVAMRRFHIGFKALDLILLTHLHTDHTAGLPGLLLTVGNAGRTEPLTVWGPPGTAALMEGVKALAPEIRFPILVRESAEPLDFYGAQITSFSCLHRVPCRGYSLTLPRAGEFMPEKARALGLPVECWRTLQRGESVVFEGRTVLSEEVLGPPRKGIKLCYCTDSRPANAIEQALEGADLAVLEGMYTDPEDQPNAEEKRHMMMTEAARMAKNASVKRLWFTHLSPKVTDPVFLPQEVLSVFPSAELGTDGKTAELTFRR